MRDIATPSFLCYPSPMQRTASLTWAFLLASCTAFAVQFRAENYAIPWLSADGKALLIAANVPTNGWTAPALVRGGVSFAATADGVPTPLWFGDEATGTVAVAVLVADCTDTPSSWSTLLDAPSPLRTEQRIYLWQRLAFATDGVSVAVDSASSDEFPIDGEKHLVEVAFSTPVAWSELFLGGHPATPAWNRSWPGRVYEIVLLEDAPTGESRDALRAYLSVKWGLGLGIPSARNARAILRRLGVKSDPLYLSVIFAR